MGLDAFGHYVPASTDTPARSAFDKLSRSLRDPFPVATTAARTALLVTLAAASPAITPSSSSPIFFQQADLPKGYRTVYTVDGSNFISMSGEFVWADAAARAAATTMAAGDFGYQVDTKVRYRYSGSAWKGWESDWITYTPTLAATVVGTGGSNTGQYRYEQGRVRVKTTVTLGTSGFTFAGLVFALPIAAATPTFHYMSYPGTAAFYDDSANVNYEGYACANAASTTDAAVLLRGTNGVRVGPNATTPFTWAANDKAITDFIYTPA